MIGAVTRFFLFLTGVIMVGYGAWLFSPALGYIVIGVLLVAGALLAEAASVAKGKQANGAPE